MAESPELDSAWIIVSCSESYAHDIEDFEINKRHIIVYELRVDDDREATPFGDEQRVYFGLRPQREPSYLFGTTDDVHFQLATAGAGRNLRVSAAHFRLEFNHHGSWMLVDLSSNGTWADGDFVASNKARHLAVSRGKPIKGNWRRRRIGPEKWTIVSAGKLQLHIIVGKETPSSFVQHNGELDLDNFYLQSNPTPSSALESSTLTQPAFIVYSRSGIFHTIESYTSGSSGAKLLVDKSTGQRVIGEVYTGTREEEAAKARYAALFETLQEGREKNLITFLESTMDGDGYMIISEYWQAKTLSELIEEELTPLPLELNFIFAQINRAAAYLNSQGIIHRNIDPEAILIARDSPVDSRLTGFSEAISAATATEVVGHQHFRAPEMSGSREYDRLVDVFSLSKVIRHCLAIQDASHTLMDPILQKGLTTDPRERCAASTIQEEIDSMTDGNYVWPFHSLRLQRRFKLAWYREDNDTHIRLADLCQVIQALANPYSASVIPSGVRTTRIDDQNFPGQYCRLSYGKRLLAECGLEWHVGILNPKSSDKGVFGTHVDLDFDLYCHTASQMFNVTTLLRTVSPDLARLATWDLRPQIQEVHGDSRWEGNYIDRRSFEKVLERVQTTEMAVLPGLTALNRQKIDTRFSRVDYSKTVIVVTRWLTPPWVLLSREEGKKSHGHHYGSRNDLGNWCRTYGLQSVADRIDRTISYHPIPQDWKVTPKIDLPPLDDDHLTSILSSHSSTSFHFTNRRVHAATQHAVLNKVRERPRRAGGSDTPHIALEDASQDENLSDPVVESPLPSDGLQHPVGAEQRPPSQSRSPCEIPSLPHLSANSIDNMWAFERRDSPLSPTNRGHCDQVTQRTESFLHFMPHSAPNIMSQESHLSQVSTSFGNPNPDLEGFLNVERYSSITQEPKKGLASVTGPPTDIAASEERHAKRQRVGGRSAKNMQEMWQKQVKHPLSESRNGYIQMAIGKKTVTMRKSDFWINATEILHLTNKNRNQRRIILRQLKRQTKVDIQDRRTWVCFKQGRALCERFSLVQELKTLLEYPEAQDVEEDHVISNQFYLELEVGESIVAIRRADFRVNATHILAVAGKTRDNISTLKRRHPNISFKGIKPAPGLPKKYRGTYVKLEAGCLICQDYELHELEKLLRHAQETTPGNLIAEEEFMAEEDSIVDEGSIAEEDIAEEDSPAADDSPAEEDSPAAEDSPAEEDSTGEKDSPAEEDSTGEEDFPTEEDSTTEGSQVPKLAAESSNSGTSQITNSCPVTYPSSIDYFRL